MHIVHTIADLREKLNSYKCPAFVPTMGNLHDGHIALVQEAKPLGDVTVSSIFVNRLQFAPHEDFDSYPRTLDADAQRLEAAGCNVLFAPREKELYPDKLGRDLIDVSSENRRKVGIHHRRVAARHQPQHRAVERIQRRQHRQILNAQLACVGTAGG